MRNIWSAVPIAVASLAFGVSTTSCGGGGGTATNPDLVLLGFNQPNVAGVALNQPLVFTFSADVDPLSITPDTLRIVGATGPFFELTHVDGNLVGLLPRTPNFDDYTDVGLFPNTQYNVSMPTFPAVDTIESTAGKPLLSAPTFTFRTVPTAVFIEARRALQHGIPPIQGGRSDDEGCIQNPENELFINPYAPGSTDPLPQQTNSVAGGRLLCLLNEGPPHVLRNASTPTHDQRAVGTPAAGSQNIGRVSLPAVRIVFNEFLDPPTVTPYPSSQLPTNVQLWRVGHLDGTTVNPPEAIRVNKPLIVQSLEGIEVILVASDAVLQGIYMVNVTANVKDLAQNRLVITDRPNLTGTAYASLDAALGPAVPQGYRYFFQTLQIAGAASAINESFGTNIAEWGDSASVLTEPGVYTQTTTATNPLATMSGTIIPAGMTTHSFTLLFGNAQPQPTTAPPPHFGTLTAALQCGQTTTANWNNGFRFLNLASLEANTDADGGLGVLKAVWRPYCGTGGDGAFDSDAFPFTAGPGDGTSLSTTPGLGASANSDGVFEYESFWLRPGDSLSIQGTKPCLILCRGDFQVDGIIDLSGAPGGFGLDTNGGTNYTNAGAIPVWGPGGVGGPGAGSGGRGAGPLVGLQNPASAGLGPKDLFGNVVPGGGGILNSTTALTAGGGGGGFEAIGQAGTREDATAGGPGGAVVGSPFFELSLVNFQTATAPFGPDRGYSPNAFLTGGTGGGGGGIDDDSGAVEGGNTTIENGDDGGGGGGGGGGGLWVIAGGVVRVGPTGQILANGGAGGHTYDELQQNVNRGADQSGAATQDDFIDGLAVGAVPSGEGGPGGGGSGGAIVLVGEGGVDIQALATLSAQKGLGGDGAAGAPAGGDGSDGRILLMGIAPNGITVSGTAVTVPTPASRDWNPTVLSDSVGQSQWIDLFTPTVVFNPIVSGTPQTPFDTNNFSDIIATGKTQGLGAGDDFCAVWEFQGADTLTPLPTAGTPTSATGLTQWNSNASLSNGKRYVRYRWRFHVDRLYPGHGLAGTPMPSILDLTIPFTK